ncbi:hypothetical protein Afil01_01410 [Actinorhabdospora filicis]|uniref:Uncharacterized protein n=1 Tax=Actinorhabdospora filicis TaxID=1785913 RepID=A0A9W6W693_9ACTN|nr:hypothetical protein [Actinorhabdospora filicis]GLZ75334.1 hypothetical protein Afil01_01410 [Actinorhabdospora filicis]
MPTAVFVALPVGVEELMRVTVAFLAAVTLAGCAAAVRLPTGRGRVLAAVASGLASAVLLTCGWYLAAPAALSLGLLARWRPLVGAPARRRP